MFEWNVEDMKLLNQKGNQKGNILIGQEKIYNEESMTSREDKIAFVDKMQDGKLSYILNLVEKFEKDKENMPTDAYGYVKTVSLKAWLKRNDNKNLIDRSYEYGSIRGFCGRNIQCINRKDKFDSYDSYVDELFHRQLKECERLEHNYFSEHDEYSILKRKFRDKEYYNTTFGVNICNYGNDILVCDSDGNRKRKITIDELKYLIEKYDELDKLIEKITAETDIKY